MEKRKRRKRYISGGLVTCEDITSDVTGLLYTVGVYISKANATAILDSLLLWVVIIKLLLSASSA